MEKLTNQELSAIKGSIWVQLEDGTYLERVWQTSKDKRSEQVKNAITLFLINGFRVTYLNLSRIADSC